MGANVSAAVGVTVIGTTLIFAIILLLWLLMSILVRVTAPRQPVGVPEEHDLKQSAAAAAVAVALAGAHAVEERSFEWPPTATVSPWQAVMRGRQLKRRGPLR
jgi:Na+-transporting methylmalonyl-CoA/oxaloacetate decarboxylase gamma subunit